MADNPALGSVVAAVVAAALGTLGAWLPWVHKRPAGYTDGQPYYTSEYVSGLGYGFDAFGGVIPFLLAAAVVAVVTRRYTGWRGDAVVAVSGLFLAFLSGAMLSNYWLSDRYAVEPGVALPLVAGLLLFVVAMRERFGTAVQPW